MKTVIDDIMYAVIKMILFKMFRIEFAPEHLAILSLSVVFADLSLSFGQN
jgi:hypothetical protein